MKRPKDNKADSFGITVTMRGKHNCTPAWVSLETHYTVETCTRSRKHNRVSSHCHHQQHKEIHQMWLQTSGLQTEAESGCYRVSSSAFPSLSHSQDAPAEKPVKSFSKTPITACVSSETQSSVCVSGRPTGSVWPRVFTHKQSNLSPDRPVWVWSPVSHSPGDTLSPQTQNYSGKRPFTPRLLCFSCVLPTYFTYHKWNVFPSTFHQRSLQRYHVPLQSWEYFIHPDNRWMSHLMNECHPLLQTHLVDFIYISHTTKTLKLETHTMRYGPGQVFH